MIVHVHSAYTPSNPEATRRHAIAQSTWPVAGWDLRCVTDAELPRLFREKGRPLPYIRDLFNVATASLSNSDIVVFTNADIGVATNARFRIAEALQFNDATYAFRRDFYHRVESPIADADIGTGRHYPGSDLFAFRAGWWRAWRDDYPDLLLAREAWDACLRVLIEQTNPNKPVSLPDIIWHERHDNGWENAAIRYSLPGQVHNLRLAYVWLTLRGLRPESFGIRRL